MAVNYNIGFLFASGPFQLPAGKRERFSLALAYGADLTELRETVRTVQLIYNANYQFAVPPPAADRDGARPGTATCGCRGTTSPSAAWTP